METYTAEYWIQHFNLLPHPEGGFYRETYRSVLEVEQKDLPIGYDGNRRLSTSIYYLLRSGEKSRFHRLRSDELWYFHYGCSLNIFLIDQEGKKHSRRLGANVEKTEQMQVLIPAGTVFAAEVSGKESYSLIGCMVSPGFEFEDFELFSQEDLVQAYPQHTDLIRRFT
jgi:predicted cupin superfamily sugar epimerase